MELMYLYKENCMVGASAFLNLAKTANCFCYIATEDNGKLTLKEYEQE